MALAWPTSASALQRDKDEAINFVPAFVYVNGARGEQVEATVLVQNQTLVDADMSVELLDMTDGRGASTAFEYEPIGTSPRGAGAWLEPDTRRFRLRAGSQREVRVAVDIPDDAGAGGHFAALMFTASETTASSQFNIDIATPVPVFITVAGNYERDLRATVISDDRWRWHGGRARWTVELHNAGDVHEVVGGTLRLDGALSNPVVTPLRAGILLPGERRRQRIEFDLRDAPDRLVARARVELDGDRDATAQAAPTYVLPWWLLVIFLVVSILAVWRFRTRRRGWEPADEDDEFE